MRGSCNGRVWLLTQLALRLLISLAGVTVVTFTAYSVIPHNPTSVGFAYLLLVLLLASTWGLVEQPWLLSRPRSPSTSFFCRPSESSPLPIRRLGGAFQLSRHRAHYQPALGARKKTGTGCGGSPARHRTALYLQPWHPPDRPGGAGRETTGAQVGQVFGLRAAVLYDRRTGEIHRAGPSDFDGSRTWMISCAMPPRKAHPSSIPSTSGLITAVRLGSEPIASFAITLATPGEFMKTRFWRVSVISSPLDWSEPARRTWPIKWRPRAAASSLFHADRRDGDEFKTPLTSIRAATTSLLSLPDQPTRAAPSCSKWRMKRRGTCNP